MTNVDTLPLILGSILTGGTNPGDFIFQNVPEPGTTLGHGESATFDVTFFPAAPGTRQAEIIAASNDPHSPALIGVSGQGTAAGISVLPSGKNFGSKLVDSAFATQTFTVQNTGTANLVLGTVQIQGTDAASFGKTNDGCSDQTFAPGASGTFDVSFGPLSAGAKSTQIAIPSGASAAFEVYFAPVSPGCKDATVQIYLNDLKVPICMVWLYGRGKLERGSGLYFI